MWIRKWLDFDWDYKEDIPSFHALFACGIAELENSIGDKKNGQ